MNGNTILRICMFIWLISNEQSIENFVRFIQWLIYRGAVKILEQHCLNKNRLTTPLYILLENDLCRCRYRDGKAKTILFRSDNQKRPDQDEDDYIPSQLLSSRPLEQSLSTSSGAKQRLSKISPRRLSLSLAGRKKLVVTMFIYDFSFPSLTISLPRKYFCTHPNFCY